MNSGSEEPTNMKIKEKLKNMLGATIQAVDNFCKLRNQKSLKDQCALIGFNTSAELVLRDINMEEHEKITNTCISKLKANGGTYFYTAFHESELILKQIDRNEYMPIIILLTDGLDHSYKQTKDLVEKVRKYSFLFIILLYS